MDFNVWNVRVFVLWVDGGGKGVTFLLILFIHLILFGGLWRWGVGQGTVDWN